VTTVHFDPFHSSASNVDFEKPTAMQSDRDRHETASSTEGGITSGVVRWLHVVPFHWRRTAEVGGCVVLPTATHHVGDTHETDLRNVEPDAGTGVTCHTPASRRSAKPL
jgi:hypothetical protein